MARDLHGKVIVITGASSGIGAATALACAKAGMNVVLNARRADKLDAVADLARQAGAEAVTVVGDVTEPGISGRMLEAAYDRFDRFDAVFANAGYGFDLALGCDIRIASDTAKLGAVFTKRAIVPESGGTWLLPRLVGWEKACEIVFRGKILSAQEALELGLVSRLVSADACLKETLTLAREIAANAPMAVQASKRMMRMGLDETFEANVHHVFLQLLPLMGSKDFREGVNAFLERREPEFEGR